MADRLGILISYRRVDTNWAAIALRHPIDVDLPGAGVFMDIESIESARTSPRSSTSGWTAAWSCWR